MPERRFETSYWSDPFVMKLPAKAKLLYIYLWTNIHCNQAGLYEIAVETISFETGLPPEEVPELMILLEPKVTWHPEQNLVWVKNFLHRQTKSPLFLVAAAKCLETINNNGLVREFLDYNQKYTLSIPYRYPIDRGRVNTLPPSYTRTGSNTERGSSLFGSFSLSEVQTFLDEMPRGVDKLAQHEAIKQRLADLGTVKGYVVRSEYAVPGGRVDLCWLTLQGEVAAGFEIDYRTPRDKSLAKLRRLKCRHAYVLLRKGGLRFIPVEQIPGEIETGEATPTSESEDEESLSSGDRSVTTPSESENVESLSEGDREVISVWRSVKGFKMSESAAAELVAKLRTDFPDVDLLVESKKWTARKLSEPLIKPSRPAGQIYNFMEKRHKWNEEKRGEYEQRKSGEGRGVPAHKPESLRDYKRRAEAAGLTVFASGEDDEDRNEDGGV